MYVSESYFRCSGILLNQNETDVQLKIYLLSAFIVTVLLVSALSINGAFADILPPKKQTGLGILPEDVVCESGMFKVTKAETNSIACVKPNTVLKLVSKGWANPVDKNSLEIQLNKQSVPLGTISKLYAEPVKTQFGKLTPKSPISGYDYTFEVCASTQKIYVPDILIKSDSETQHYEIPENIEPNTCALSTTFIRAANPETIKVTLLNKGDVSNVLSEMESKISSLQEELATARKLLGDKSSPDTNQGSKISDLRKQLNDAKEDLHRLYFTLYAVPNEKYNTQKISFTGVPIEGETANLIAAKKSISGENTYDAVFEACAGKNQVRLPVITITSDRESINVNLGDRIAPGSCQMTSAKIMAGDPSSIQVIPAGNTDSNNKISELENDISKLQKELNNSKDLLRSLLHDPKRPSNFNEQVEMHSANIIDLRNQINMLKADYNEILYQVYR